MLKDPCSGPSSIRSSHRDAPVPAPPPDSVGSTAVASWLFDMARCLPRSQQSTMLLPCEYYPRSKLHEQRERTRHQLPTCTIPAPTIDRTRGCAGPARSRRIGSVRHPSATTAIRANRRYHLYFASRPMFFAISRSQRSPFARRRSLL